MKRTELKRRTPLKTTTTLKRTGPIKAKRKASSKAMKSARGKPCLIRLPGCAPGPDNETVVGCHFSLPDVSGAGLKSPDVLIAYGCHNCHAIVDGRAPIPHGYTWADVRLAFAHGVFRTQLMNGLDMKLYQ